MARRIAALVALGLAIQGVGSYAQEARPPVDPLEKKPAPVAPVASESGSGKSKSERREDRPDRPERPDRGDKPDRPGDGPGWKGKGGGRFFGPPGPEADKAREAFRNMTPEERERWLRRFRQWADMSPERKKSLEDREEMFRRKMREDIEEALKATNLSLNDEQKKQFATRYAEERRKIEEQIRKEMEEKRRPQVQALVEKLKNEFSGQTTSQPQ